MDLAVSLGMQCKSLMVEPLHGNLWEVSTVTHHLLGYEQCVPVVNKVNPGLGEEYGVFFGSSTGVACMTRVGRLLGVFLLGLK